MEFEIPKENEKSEKVKFEEYYNSIYYMMPKDKESIESFLSIDRQTKVAVKNRFDITIKPDWESFTLASVYLITLTAYVMNACKRRSGEKVTHHFYDMLTLQSSLKKNLKAEKVGSLNIVISPGDALIKIRENPEEFWCYDKSAPGDIFLPKNGFDENVPYDKNTCESIDKIARLVAHRKHSISIPDGYPGLITAVAYTFFENMFKHILYKTSKSESEPKLEIILMGELLDVNGFEDEEGELRVSLIPGASLKIDAKGDDITELLEE